MAVKLYVGNLPYSTTDADLNELFAEYGTVASATVIKNPETGRSKGFGFVEIDEDEKAKEAIEALNGKDLGGRDLVVNEARARDKSQARPRRDFNDQKRGGGGSFRQRSW